MLTLPLSDLRGSQQYRDRSVVNSSPVPTASDSAVPALFATIRARPVRSLCQNLLQQRLEAVLTALTGAVRTGLQLCEVTKGSAGTERHMSAGVMNIQMVQRTDSGLHGFSIYYWVGTRYSVLPVPTIGINY